MLTKFLAEQWIISAWPVTLTLIKPAKVLWINNNSNNNNNKESATFWNLKPAWGTTGSGGYLPEIRRDDDDDDDNNNNNNNRVYRNATKY